MLRKHRCKLLPFEREDIFGLDYNNQQIIPWSISEFKVEKSWIKSKGKGVTVAVIDTGCDLDHPDLKDNLVDGYDFINGSRYPTDDNGHGTHVAGTIAASNNGKGIVGVAPQAKIMPLKSLGGDGSGDLKHICQAILYAADNNADIITMSLGTTSHASIFQQTLEYAVSKGCVIFCAAGNEGKEKELMYPARYPETISVGSISNTYKISRFSCSKGTELDFFAPGENVISCVPDDSYANMTGTSMANPFAAGCGALLLSYKGRKLKQKDYVKHFEKYSIKPDHLFRIYKSRGIITPRLI
jgi:major intracellular serine protease